MIYSDYDRRAAQPSAAGPGGGGSPCTQHSLVTLDLWISEKQPRRNRVILNVSVGVLFVEGRDAITMQKLCRTPGLDAGSSLEGTCRVCPGMLGDETLAGRQGSVYDVALTPCQRLLFESSPVACVALAMT